MKRPKYNARKVIVDGVKFDSKGEYARWLVLRDMEARGEIRNLERQIRVDLIGKNGPILSRKSGRKRQMVWDFRYFEQLHAVYEDFKGMILPDWQLKADVFANQNPNVIIRISGKGGVK